MLVPHLLLETLEDLCDNDFELFKWYLSQPLLSGCEPIAKSRLQSPARHDTVSRMIDCYNETPAVDITVEALKKMKHNNAAQQLKKTYTEGSAAEQNPGPTAYTSSSALQQPESIDSPRLIGDIMKCIRDQFQEDAKQLKWNN